MKKSRRTEVYRVLLERELLESGENEKSFEELEKIIIMEEFLESYYSNNIHTASNNKKVKIDSEGICYYIAQTQENNRVRRVKMNYIKFNKNSNVVDANSLELKYKKDKNEGDEEYQHYVIKTFENSNRAAMVIEKISGAITIGMLRKHMNLYYKNWVKEKYKEESQKDTKKYLLEFEIKLKIVPSPDLIKELESLDKISLIKLTADKENVKVDEEINFSGENFIREDVELIYKPAKNFPIPTNKAKKYLEIFEGKNSKKTKIKRIVINGRKNGNPISIDTEQMKLIKYIEIVLDSTGFVNSDILFQKYEDLINKDFKEYFNNLFIEEDESEE